MLDQVRSALILAPHHDDEVLGCGGVIARLADAGAVVHVAVVTSGAPPRFSAEAVRQVRAEAGAAHQVLGVTRTHYLDFPAAELDSIPHARLNAAIGGLIATLRPDTLFVPFIGDVHLDHQLVFASAMVAARPQPGGYPARILAYETLSETNWNAPLLTAAFVPNVFIDITAQLARKLQAFALYASQVQPAPHERSLASLQALATLRGATAHLAAAEAFMLIREVG